MNVMTDAPTGGGSQPVYEALQALDIAFEIVEHPPVLTVAEAEQYWATIDATHCKNLFLRNRKGTMHYLLVLEHSKRVDLKTLAGQLGEDALSFASADRLAKYLGLSTGAVSPFGLLNDATRAVCVVLDADLKKAARIAFHPNVNTATIALAFADFQRFLASRGNAVRYVPA